MVHSTFHKAKISGMAVTLGEQKRNFEDNPVFYNSDEELLKRLKKTIGFGTQYVSKENTTTCDLCLDAATRLIAKMSIDVENIDAIIFVTQTPDYYMPGNAHIIHEKMGFAKTTAALDIEMGCSGFIYGLWLAFMMVETGMERILLLTGDTLSKAVHPDDRTEAPLFGDAGAAVIIEKAKKESPSYFIVMSDGSGVKNMLQPGGAYRKRSSEETRELHSLPDGAIRCEEHIYMNGFEIFNFTLTEQPAILNEILDLSKVEKENIDYFFIHQGNKYIVDTLAKSAKLPKEKVPVIFPDYGNQNSASIPGTICAAVNADNFKDPKKVILQGFGIGLSWGASQLELNDVTILPPHIYGGE